MPTVREQFEELLINKRLNPKSFIPGKLRIWDDIALHSEWAFKHIYSVPYPRADASTIARAIHGIQHTARAASYIPILTNLYRRHGDPDALKLTNDDIKLLQIATLLHDAAREDEKDDRWDRESAEFIYNYLTEILKVSEEKAILIAEAMANKDFEPPQQQEQKSYNSEHKKYFCLEKVVMGRNSRLVWKESQHPPKSKSIYQKLIHDADCLDIIRACKLYNGTKLDFYQSYAINNDQAFDEMADLIVEARRMIHVQGDSYDQRDYKTKLAFEHGNAYRQIVKNLHELDNPVMQYLFNNGNILPEHYLKKPFNPPPKFDPNKPLDNANIKAALREGKVFCRSIRYPSYIRKKENHGEENMTAQEIYKMNRRLGVPTRSTKANRAEKDGNPGRSISMLGWGAPPFSPVGYLMVGLEMKNVEEVYYTDVGTGHGKKKNSGKVVREDAQFGLDSLLEKQKLGGSEVNFGNRQIATHNEILYRVKQADAIYFTHDHTYANPKPCLRHSRKLQAIFIQKEFERMNQKTLPIFEYSWQKNFIEEVKPCEEKEIILMWVEMCSDYMQKQFKDGKFDESITDIKINAMYHEESYLQAKRSGSADSNYPVELQQLINQAIVEKRNQLLHEHALEIEKKVKEEKASIFEYSCHKAIVAVPGLMIRLKNEIAQQISAELQKKDFFSQDFSYCESYSTSARACKLAVEIGMHDIAGIIMQHAIETANKYLAQIKTTQEYFSLYEKWGNEQTFNCEKLFDLIKYTQAFGITHLYQDDIACLLCKIENKMLEDLKDESHVRYSWGGLNNRKIMAYKEFIKFIDDYDLAPAGKNRMHEMLRLIADKCIHKKILHSVHDFIEMAFDALLPDDEIIRFMRTWLADDKIYPSNYSTKIIQILSLLRNLSSVHAHKFLNNPDIIALIIQQSHSRQEFLFCPGYFQSISFFLSNLDQLKNGMPAHRFNEFHLALIQRKFESVANEFVNELFNKLNEFTTRLWEFKRQILALDSSSFPLVIPDSLKMAFDEIVSGLTENEREQNQHDIEFIKEFFKNKTQVKKPESALQQLNVFNKLLLNKVEIIPAAPQHQQQAATLLPL